VSSLGIANPPGFPLYMLIGKVFTLLPLGNTVYSLEILSHVGALIFLASTYVFIKRITSKTWPAVFGTLSLAFSYNLWSQAGNVETFTLTNGLMYLFLLWVLELNPKSKLVLLAAFIGGVLSGLNPVISAIVSVGIYWLYTNRETVSKNSKLYIAASILAILGVAAIYSYLPIRSLSAPYMNWGNPVNFENIKKHLVGAGLNIYEPETGSINGFTGQPKVWLESALHFLNLAFYQFTPFLFPLIFVGGYFLWKTKNKYFWPLAILSITNFSYVVLYYGGNQESWTITSWGALAVFIGVGANIILNWIAKQESKFASLAKWLFLSLSLLPILFWFTSLNHSKYFFADDYTENMYRDLPKNSVIVGGGDYFFSLTAYNYQVLKYRTDVTPVVGNMFYIFDWYRNGLRKYGGLNISSDLEKMIQYKSVDEFTNVVDELVKENPDRQFYITSILLRDTVVAGHKDGNYHTTKYQLIPHGLLFKIAPLGSLEMPDDDLYKFTFKNPEIMTKQPFYMERNYKNAYKLLRDDYAQAFSDLGEYYLAKGDKQKAESNFMTATYFGGPGEPQYYNRLAVFYIGENKPTEARNNFEKALAQAPENKDLLFNYQKFLDAISGSTQSSKRQFYESKQFVFYYLSDWTVNEDKSGLVQVLSPDKRFRIEITMRNKADVSFASHGTLVQEGQAKIPNSDQASIRIWDDGGIKKYEFNIFRGGNVFNVLVYPANSPLMSEFDQIVGTLEAK
jgi:hypothetical protein